MRVVALLSLVGAPLGAVAACDVTPQGLGPGSRFSVDTLTASGNGAIDVLLVIDDSASMAGRQATLPKATAEMVRRLIEPACVGADGAPIEPATRVDVLGRCPSGSRPERTPIRDLNVGVITTSLGAAGRGDRCVGDDGAEVVRGDARARLLARSTPGGVDDVPTWRGRRFLAWDPDQVRRCEGDAGGYCPGLADVDELLARLEAIVGGVGTGGCGDTSPLEAAWRFLGDPEPPLAVDASGHPSGVDEDLLAERAVFLRESSGVRVAIVSDADDGSFRLDGVGAYPTERYVNAFGAVTIDTRRLDLRDDGSGRDNPLGYRTHLVAVADIPWKAIARQTAKGEPDLVRGLDALQEPRGGYRTPEELERAGMWDAVLLPEAAELGAGPPRLLEVIRALGEDGGLASIEPPRFTPDGDARGLDVGFDAALIDEAPFYACGTGYCWGRPLEVDDEGDVACHVIEATDSDGDRDEATPGKCDCEQPGRRPVSLEDGSARLAEALREGMLLEDPSPGYDCFCVIPQLGGDPEDPSSDRYACQHEEVPPLGVDGWCYVDPAAGIGSAELTMACSRSEKYVVRLVGRGALRPEARATIACASR